MKAIDMLIIYLACGLPFAANAFIKTDTPAGLPTLIRSLAALLGWPVLVPRVVVDAFGRNRSESHPARDAAQMRTALEQEWYGVIGDEGVAAFREAVERYVGISLALRDITSEPVRSARFELFEVVDHGDVAVGSACLARRNREKLLFNQTQSRTELIDSVLQLHRAGARAAVSIAIELARTLGDEAAEIELRSVRADLAATKLEARGNTSLWSVPENAIETAKQL